MNKVKFTQTTSTTLPTIPLQAGTLYFCKDTGKIYLDTESGEEVTRILYGADSDNFVLKSGDTMTGPLHVTTSTTSGFDAEIAPNSISLKDFNGDSFFDVTDLRDESGQITDHFTANGTDTGFALVHYPAASTDYSVKVDDVEVTTGLTKTKGAFSFDTPPSEGSKIEVTYVSKGYTAFAFTFGRRDTSGTIGDGSVAIGGRVTASGFRSFAQGGFIKATGDYSHAEGEENTASGKRSHAEGGYSKAIEEYSHAEGYKTQANGPASHAEGSEAIASGKRSHAEGNGTTASGDNSHAEGGTTTASGAYSHAEGYHTTASGTYSHAQNRGTIASKVHQTAIGKYNIEDTETNPIKQKAFIIGNGTDDNTRSNAFTVDWDGTITGANRVNSYGGIGFNLGGAINPHTTDVTIWGRGDSATSNKVGIAVTNDEDNIQYALIARNSRIVFRDWTNSNDIWNIYPNATLTKTITVTTQANTGNMNLQLNGADYHVLGVVVQNPYIAVPFMYTSAGGAIQWWAKIVNNDASWTPVATTSITATVYYEANRG